MASYPNMPGWGPESNAYITPPNDLTLPPWEHMSYATPCARRVSLEFYLQQAEIRKRRSPPAAPPCPNWAHCRWTSPQAASATTASTQGQQARATGTSGGCGCGNR
jgi:hypothetical protein